MSGFLGWNRFVIDNDGGGDERVDLRPRPQRVPAASIQTTRLQLEPDEAPFSRPITSFGAPGAVPVNQVNPRHEYLMPPISTAPLLRPRQDNVPVVRIGPSRNPDMMIPEPLEIGELKRPQFPSTSFDMVHAAIAQRQQQQQHPSEIMQQPTGDFNQPLSMITTTFPLQRPPPQRNVEGPLQLSPDRFAQHQQYHRQQRPGTAGRSSPRRAESLPRWLLSDPSRPALHLDFSWEAKTPEELAAERKVKEETDAAAAGVHVVKRFLNTTIGIDPRDFPEHTAAYRRFRQDAPPSVPKPKTKKEPEQPMTLAQKYAHRGWGHLERQLHPAEVVKQEQQKKATRA